VQPGTETKSSYRITEGQDANPREWPFIVAVFSKLAPAEPFCGGTLINQRWVLTAGHCLYIPRRNLAGERTYDPHAKGTLFVRRPAPNGKPDGETAQVAEYFIEPNYSPQRGEHDVALLKLAQPMQIANHELAILATAGTEAVWSKPATCAAVAGWGETNKSAYNGKLQAVTVPIVGLAECAAKLQHHMKAEGQFNTIQAKPHLCAGYTEGGKDSCQGDSGGPLIVRAGPTGALLVGLVSFGFGCGAKDTPGVYARASSYRDWVFSIVGRN
jgi:secreted trypsin-like serine protease